MARIIVGLGIAILSLGGAVGCAGPDLRPRVEELTREREELIRERMSLEGRLSAAEAREAALLRQRTSRTSNDGPAADLKLPDHLKAKGVTVRSRGGDTVIDLPSDVFFASGSAKLTPAGEKALGGLSELVRKTYKDSEVRVEGHADSDPIKRSKGKFHCNWELSFERAHAVVHYLIDKCGFDPKRLSADCFGDTQPIDPANKAKNRRVELVIAR